MVFVDNKDFRKMQKEEIESVRLFVRATATGNFQYYLPVLVNFIKTIDFAPRFKTDFPYTSVTLVVSQ